MFCMSCVTFWVVLLRMVFDSRRFGTLCLFHFHSRVDAKLILHPITYEEGTDTVFRNVDYQTPYAGEQPKPLHTTINIVVIQRI
jgi:hypothetical protein